MGVTPVPIPNTMVKTHAADGTWLETARESRWLPDSFSKESDSFEKSVIGAKTGTWGCSSVGRAPALQAGGQEFEPLHLHRNYVPKKKAKAFGCTLTNSYRQQRNQNGFFATYIIGLDDPVITTSSNKRAILCYARQRSFM